jgi:hypothetical protein
MDALIEVFEKFKHLDILLYDPEWGKGSAQAQVLKECWMAIKAALTAAQAGVTWTKIDDDMNTWECACKFRTWYEEDDFHPNESKTLLHCENCGGKITKFEPPLEVTK